MQIRIRTYRETDLTSVVAVINASSAYDGIAFFKTEAEFQKRLESGKIGNRMDVFIAEAPDGELLGYAEGFLRGEAGERLYATHAAVLPQFRRMGVGSGLLEALWQRAGAISADLGDEPVMLGSRIAISQTGAIRLFEKFGMQPVRNFYEMRRDLAQPIPDPQPLPGIELRLWGDDHWDYQVWEAAEEAFNDHWRHIPMSFDEFQHRMRTQGFNRERSFLALSGELVVGGALNFMGPDIALRRGENQGQIGILFVRRPWRKRGVGSALVLASLQEGLHAGHTSMELNVDADNLSGAVRLYEALGFTVAQKNIIYEREVHPPAG